MLDLDLSCFGFGGECHLDPLVARVIRDHPADAVFLCLGINVYGAGSLSPRSLVPAVLGFLATIRDGHPAAPILVMTPIASPERENTKNAVGMTLQDMRRDVALAVSLAQEAGDSQLTVIEGTDVLGLGESALLPDGLHPNDEGYALMADRIAPHVARAFGAQPAERAGHSGFPGRASERRPRR